MRTFQDFPILGFTQSPLDPILNEIDRLFGFGFFYSAIALSLSLPDICSTLEIDRRLPNPFKHTQKRYTAWCKTYLQPKFAIFDAADCWALRGGVLHNGTFHSHPNSKYDRIAFLPPPAYAHEMVSQGNGGSNEKAIVIDIERFCHLVVAAVQEWHAEKRDDEFVQLNLQDLVRLRPGGLKPHIVGVPVIA